MFKHYQIKYTGYSDYSPIFLMNGTAGDFVIRASQLDSDWSKPGSVYCKLTDTDNDLIIDLEGRKIKLNYSEAEILRLALKINAPDVKLYELTKKRVL